MFRLLSLSALLFVAASAAGTTYYTNVTVADVWDAGTDDDIIIRYIGGERGNNIHTMWHGLNEKGVNDLEMGRTYHYEHKLDVDVGKVGTRYNVYILLKSVFGNYRIYL